MPVTVRHLVAALALAGASSCVRDAPVPPGSKADGARHATATATPPAPAGRIIARRRKCMGTECEMTAFHHDETAVEAAFGRGFDELARIESLTTSWRDDSDVSRVNAAAGKSAVVVAPETMEILKKSLWLAERSEGAFDITVGVFKGLWKFDEDKDGTLPRPAEVKKRLRLVGWRDVIVDEAARTVRLRRAGQRINLEGVAKGYAVDAAVRAIRAAGVHNFIVKAGGDLFASGRRPDREWRVGIQDPRGPRGQVIFDLLLSDRAFNTSGDYERFIVKDGTRYHHILDARTGFPSRMARGVTLLAPDAFTADALDTAVFVMGPERGLKLLAEHPGVEAVIVDANNRVHVTPGLEGRIRKRADPTPGI